MVIVVTIMSLVKISRINLSLFVNDVIAFIHAFLSQTGRQYIDIQANSINYIDLSFILSFFLSLSHLFEPTAIHLRVLA